MRIRIIQKPAVNCIDGVRLDQFRPGHVYHLGSLMAGVFLAEGWAEPVDDQETGRHDAPAIPRNLTREFFPPYYDGSPSALAAEQASRRRPRRRRK
jgi:hypothetical protein